MKKFTHFLTEFFLLQRFQVYILMFLLVFSLSSCFQKFYNTNTAGKTDSAMLEKFRSENKLFIVHTPEGPFALKNVTVNAEIISGEKAPIDPAYAKYLTPKKEGTNHLQMSKSDVVLNEVHLYTNLQFNSAGKVNLGINEIFRTDAYGFDKEATKNSRVTGIIGITVGTAAIVGAAALVASGLNDSFHGITFSLHD
jgi:hypothetical protein